MFSHMGKIPTTKVIQKKLNRVCHDRAAPYNQWVSNQLPKLMGTRCQHICRNSLPTVHFSSRYTLGRSRGSKKVFMEVVMNVTSAYKAALTTSEVCLTWLIPKGCSSTSIINTHRAA